MKRIDHNKVREIFLKAIEIEPGKLQQFLSEACGEDRYLRNEVESLLKHNSTKTIIDRDNKSVDSQVGHFLGPKLEKDSQKSSISGKVASKLFGSKIQRNIGIIATVVLVCLLGYLVHNEIESRFEEMIVNDLEVVINANAQALTIWIEDWKSDSRLVAQSPRANELIREVVKFSAKRPVDKQKLYSLPHHKELQNLFSVYMEEKDILAYTVFDETGTAVSSTLPEIIGTKLTPEGAKLQRKIFNGETKFSKPYPLGSMIDYQTIEETGQPVVFVNTPIYNNTGEIIASLGFGTITPKTFTDILNVARIGKTGESYAFDRDANLLSESRYENELKDVGILPNKADVFSAFKIQIRDPQVDLLAGKTPLLEQAARPKTRLAALAVASGQNENKQKDSKGIIIEPYNNYLGKKVIGAWVWLDNYDFGLAAEVSLAEAYSPLFYLDLTFAVLFLVIIISTGIALFSSFSIVRLRNRVGIAEKLGQYTLVKLIGEGGMGSVYLAKHALLKRPAAIKILKPDKVNKETITRFEREVQLVSQLSHPNTIEIFDFGLTDDGIFYYAMEYIHGYSVMEIIAKHGKMNPARVVHILIKVCSSLYEAHLSGLIHRDIKPHNIMISRRIDEYDLVKVLDFGLVKNMGNIDPSQATETARISGTLLYMAPERLKNSKDVDARTDIYSLGATAYYMLTGQNAYNSETDMEIMYNIMNEAPISPSAILQDRIPDELEKLILNCLAKDMNDRPSSVIELIKTLEEIQKQIPWDQSAAKNWWSENPTK